MAIKTKNKKFVTVITVTMLIFSISSVATNTKASAVKVGKTKNTAISVDDENNVRLTWKAVKGAKKYEIFRASKKNGKFRKIKTVSKCSHILRSRNTGKKYYYKVRAYKMNSGKKIYGAFSSVKTVTLQQKKNSNDVLQPPVYTPVEDINKASAALSCSMFFTVSGISDGDLLLTSETNPYSKTYIMAKPDNMILQVGSRLKVINPKINQNTDKDNRIQITDCTGVNIPGELCQFNKPLYVINVSDGILSLTDDVSKTEVSFTLDTKQNEILVTKNEQICTIGDIKTGDKLSIYVSSPVRTGIPGTIIDCTKIYILD